jgi:hypothetical protein
MNIVGDARTLSISESYELEPALSWNRKPINCQLNV